MPIITMYFIRRGQRRIILRGTWPELMSTIRAWCPGGKVVEIFDAAGGIQ